MSSHNIIAFEKVLKSVKVSRPSIVYQHMQGKLDELKQQLQAQYQSQIDTIRSEFFGGIDQEYERMVQQVSERLPDLVLAMVRRVLGKIELKREDVESIVQSVIEENAPEGEPLEVYLSVEDYEKLLDENARKEGKIKGHPNVRFIENASLGTGDCMIKSRFGEVDARVETKLKQLSREMC